MRQATIRLAIAACTLVAMTQLAGEREAAACGGCFHPPAQVASDITDERMLLSVSPQQTTLYDQIRYAGSPTSFAWVLPIKGTVDVGLSADVLFDTVDALTATQINPPIQNCPPPPDCGGDLPTANGLASGSGSDDSAGVTVTKSQNVGPYETVQLHATDPSALSNWLATNGFDIPADVTPIIAAYVTEGFDFLAMKLLPDQGVQAMRPVRVTSPGASLSLPLRMAAIGTGATVGITIWVVSSGRYEPQNFPSFHIEDTDLVWDFNASVSNYTTLRASHEAALHGSGWEIESSIDIATQTIANAILNGGNVGYNGGGTGSPTASADDDYAPVGNPDDAGTDASADGGDAGGAPYQSADDVRAADIQALFTGQSSSEQAVRITRMRSDISHTAMTTDFILQASADQSELTNVRFVTKSVNAPACPSYPGCGIFSCETSTGRPIIGGAGLIATALGLLGLFFTRKLRKAPCG